MNGKQKCEMLRSIRMNIAQKYGIEYEPEECEHEECATGTCPLCEQEAEHLLDELRKRKKAGELDKIGSEILRGLVFLSKEPTDEEDEELVLSAINALPDDELCVGEIDDKPDMMGDIAVLEDDDQDGDEQEDDDQDEDK